MASAVICGSVASQLSIVTRCGSSLEGMREAHAGEALAAVAGISHMEPAAHAAPPRVAAYCLVSGGLYSALKSSSSRSAATSVLRLIQAMSHPSSHARTAATSSAVSW